LAQEASLRFDDLQIQFTILQRACSVRDRPLCDTLNFKNFDEIGFLNELKQIRSNQILQRIKLMGDIETKTTVKNLSSEIDMARNYFRSYSVHVKQETATARNGSILHSSTFISFFYFSFFFGILAEVLEQLEFVKNITTAKTKIISTTVHTVLDKVDDAWKYTEPFLDELIETGSLNWLIGVSVTVSVLGITLIFMSGLTCACQNNADNKSGFTLTTGSVITSIASLGLAVFIAWDMLLGGHGQVFLCGPLNEFPNYTILTKLLDRPGIIYQEPPTDGIINEIIRAPGNNTDISVNVSLSSVINACEINKPAYSTFQLGQLVNVRRVLDMKKYAELEEAIDDIKATDSLFIGFTANLQTILSEMMYESDINISSYRIDMTFISPEKDIVTFIDQMQRVSAQIQDVATSSRMTTLGSRAKRVQMSLLQPLEHLRGEIVYHLTALELEISPWIADVS
jgi:hypothetical protein